MTHGRVPTRHVPECDDGDTGSRIPRVARLLALAHRFEHFIADGVVADYGELARRTRECCGRGVSNIVILDPAVNSPLLSQISLESMQKRRENWPLSPYRRLTHSEM